MSNKDFICGKLFSFLCITLFLTACGGGSNDGGDRNMMGKPMEPEIDLSKSIQQRIQEGETITTSFVVGMRFNWDNNTTQVDDWDDLKVIQRPEDGAYVVTVEGNPLTFTNAEFN